MKIFLDTAHKDKIASLIPTGLIDGITTNPTSLSKISGDISSVLQELVTLFPHGEVSIEVTESIPEKIYEQAKKIAGLGSNVVVKIPCHQDYYSVINKLVKEGVALNITLIFSALQALMMAKLGVKYVSPFVGRLEEIDSDGIELIHDIAHMFSLYDMKTSILAASLRSVRHMHDVLMAGADVITVAPDLLFQAMHHPLTNEGLQKFMQDWEKSGHKNFF